MEDKWDFIRRSWRQRRRGNTLGITLGWYGPNLQTTYGFNVQSLSIKFHCPPSNAFGNMKAEIQTWPPHYVLVSCPKNAYTPIQTRTHMCISILSVYQSETAVSIHRENDGGPVGHDRALPCHLLKENQFLLKPHTCARKCALMDWGMTRHFPHSSRRMRFIA